MKKEAYTIHSSLKKVEDYRFFATKKQCQEEINRLFRDFPSLKKLGNIKPVKVTIEFDLLT